MNKSTSNRFYIHYGGEGSIIVVTFSHADLETQTTYFFNISNFNHQLEWKEKKK